MYLYSIVALDTDHVDEICEDIRQQYEAGVANCALFCMTLVPEGNPPIPKAEQMCAKFDLFRDKLEPLGIKCGMLMQASIGHGYPLDRMFPFERLVNLTDGAAQNSVCPYDEGFREYIRHTMMVLASHKPACIMVDDDFRLIIRPGKGNPVIIRINNGNYTPAGARGLSAAFMRAAVQVAVLKGQGHVDSILAETDTCPQNRYSTGAQSLHSHFTGTILEGASGAKHWITRLSNFEPKSGVAYRKILSKNKGFYDALAELVPTLKWRGCRMPLSKEPDYAFKERVSVNAWTTHLLERFGLPVFFSENESKVAFLEGRTDVRFTDAELLEMFKNTVVLDGGAAERMCARGFAKYIGVEVRPWTGKNVTGERFLTEGGTCKSQVGARELIPLDGSVQVDSVCYHVPDGVTEEPLFPGCTVYKNELGGTAIVFCGNVRTVFNYFEAFSFLNETRKRQFVRLLSAHGDLPVYYPDDAEVYLRAADCPDGSTLVAFFNIGLDPIERLTLAVKKMPTAVEVLEPDGSRKPCGFQAENGIITVDRPAGILDPVVLFLK